MRTTPSSLWRSWNATSSTIGQDDLGADEEGSLEDYDEIVWNAVEPNWLEYGSLAVFALLLVTGLVGNFLVIFVVIRNECMRTMTNYFLVNLAFSDFMVLLFCLPFTVLWEITKTWWFGTALCKIIVYWQLIDLLHPLQSPAHFSFLRHELIFKNPNITLSVSVSILTLTCISVERWHAICHPLAFKNTFKRTRISLVVIWVSAALLSLPEMVILRAKPLDFAKENYTSTYLTQCTHTWDDSLQQAYQLAQTSVLYVLPLSCMGVLYGHIAYVLWLKSIPPSDCFSPTPRVPGSTTPAPTANNISGSARRNSLRSTLNSSADYSPVVGNTLAVGVINGERRISCPDRPKPPRVASVGRNLNASGGVKASHSTTDQWKEREIMNRKKAAKMLIAIVILFGICYLPTHVLNILTYFGAVPDLKLGVHRSVMYLSIRFMCYFNSCINPIVYNFMSEKFQKEFRRACSCLPSRHRGSNLKTGYESFALLAQGRGCKLPDQVV